MECKWKFKIRASVMLPERFFSSVGNENANLKVRKNPALFTAGFRLRAPKSRVLP